MLNHFAKFWLVSSSLAPLFGAIAINQYVNDQPALSYCIWLGFAFTSVFLCWLMIERAQKSMQNYKFRIEGLEQKDTESLLFFVTYMLPFLSGEKIWFTGQGMLVEAYILFMVFIVIFLAEAFHFNLILRILGYHIYAVKDKDGGSRFLISKSKRGLLGSEVEAIRLSDNIYLHMGDEHV